MSTAVLTRLRSRRKTRSSTFGPATWIALAVLGVVALLAAFGPLLISSDPNAVNLGQAFLVPTSGHPLGQDSAGRDLFARLVFGTRTAVVGPLLVVAISTVLGTAIALTSVWFGGALDTVVARVLDAVFAFPGLLLAILATALFGAGLPAAVVALSIAYVPYLARIVRSAALRERGMPYIAALRVQGISSWRINLRHILPNVGTLIIANATLSFGFALIDLAGLSFIGLGVQAPTADWGAMVGTGLAGVNQGYPEEAIYASILIVLTVGAANMLGDKLTARSETRR